MKIKCPSCSAVLNVPDTAAGKIVKCPCGKQLRAPGGAAAPAAQQPAAQKPAAAQQRPSAQQPSAKRATPQRPGIQRQPAAPASPQQAGGAGFTGFEGGLFDELTDGDLQPVTAVAQPGVKKEQQSTGGKLLQQFSGGEVEGGKQTQPGDRPGNITFLGVINGIWALLWIGGIALLLGAAAMLGVDEDTLLEVAQDQAFWLIVMVVGLNIAVFVTGAVACFVPHWFCWQLLLFNLGWALGYHVVEIVGIFQGEMNAKVLVKSIVYLLAWLYFFVYVHGEETREYYRIGELSIKKVIVADLLGIVGGLAMGALLILA